LQNLIKNNLCEVSRRRARDPKSFETETPKNGSRDSITVGRVGNQW